ncbi:MAG TPA: alpha-(1-_3)-arabinofuranosyltransferase family protein [Acidimicrobiales bacterium]|nr:alpha-(1->3)-arabinofuranosyltransferase family protein [Acidimicrobiales bacterium]
MTSAFTITASRGSRGRHAAKRGAKKGDGEANGEASAGNGGNGSGGNEAGAPVASAALSGAVVKRGRWWWIGGLAAVAGLAYVPLLAVRPGVVTPDTKTFLYLDPTKFLSQVAFMWNPTVALGTVNHQYIGYLFPMGPFYTVFHLLGVPVWVAQRLWLGTILFGAGLGVLYLSRILGQRGPGPVAAALAYMLSPYFLQYSGRISVILLPWAGLPFMLGLTIVALRRGGWREPALFAFVVALVSGINASSVIYVGVAPILWLFYAVVVLRESTWRHALATGLRISVLTLGASLWWIAGLEVEAAYGVNVLKFTETVPSTSATSNPADILRGLGYWYFYGTDHLGPWTNAAVRYTQNIWLIGTSLALPVVSLVAAAFVRWKERAYFLVLLFVGLVLSVGPFPYADPTRIGGWLKSFMTDTTAGLALRSTDRATPLILLALFMLLGSALTALWLRLSFVGIVTAVCVAGLVVANIPSLFNGDTIANNFTQPASLPSYELAAINHLNATHPGTRVFAIPGNDFASYDWGDTVDTPQPALLNRNFVTREQQVMGSIATADTLYAIDGPIQDGIANWNALAPMSRLMGAGDVMVEYDQRYEHYGIPQPQLLSLQLLQTPAGLSDPQSFGTPRPNDSTVSTLNEEDLSVPGNLAWPAPIVTYTVPDPRALLRGESDSGAVVMEGDATGLNNLAGLGLLNTSSAIYYAGTLGAKPQLKQLASQGAQLVVTDTNRKQAFRWDTLTANAGYTETPDENPAKTDLSDSPIELFPGSGITSKTNATYVGAVNVTASSYGNGVSYTPEDQAYSAIDNNLDTAWITGTFVPDPKGEWWQAQFTNAVTTDHITVVQPQRGDRSRWVSGVTLTFDGKDPIQYGLTAASHLTTGQTLTFPARTFHTLRVTLDGTTDNSAPPLTAAAVGFSEIEIPGQSVRQVLQMPTQMLSSLGAASAADRLSVVMTRARTSGYPPRSDPETTISRAFTLPTARTFTLSGSASLSSLIPDDEIDRLVGRSESGANGVRDAYSSGRLPGDLKATASATVDGSSATAWQPGLGTKAQIGASLTYDLTKPQALTRLDLRVIADGRHSVPTALTITSGLQVRQVTLPAIADSPVPGAVTTVPLTFPAINGSHFTVTFTAIRPEYAANYYSAGPLALPIGIAEIGIPGVTFSPTPPALPGNCVSNLLTIDGQPISVAVTGSTTTALNGGEVQVTPCGPDAKGITLAAGTHVVQSALGHNPPCASAPTTCTGWNLDQLGLDSAAGGVAGPVASPTAEGTPSLPATQPGPVPTVTQTSSHIDTLDAKVTGATQPFEFVLGESVNKGWRAVATPGPGAPPGSHPVDLGPPQLVDGFANGWHVTADDLHALGGANFTVTLTWTPQQLVWIALAISGATLLLCLVLGFLPVRSRRWLRARVLPRRLRGPAGPDAPERPSDPFDAPSLTLPYSVPTLGEPRHGWVRFPRALVLGAATGGVTLLVAPPKVALAVGVLVALGLVLRWARAVAVIGGIAFVVAGCLNVVEGQRVHHYLPGSNWAGSFVHAGNLIWIGVVLLVADAVISSFGLRVRKPLRRSKLRAVPVPATSGAAAPTGETVTPVGGDS